MTSAVFWMPRCSAHNLRSRSCQKSATQSLQWPHQLVWHRIFQPSSDITFTIEPSLETDSSTSYFTHPAGPPRVPCHCQGASVSPAAGGASVSGQPVSTRSVGDVVCVRTPSRPPGAVETHCRPTAGAAVRARRPVCLCTIPCLMSGRWNRGAEPWRGAEPAALL